MKAALDYNPQLLGEKQNSTRTRLISEKILWILKIFTAFAGVSEFWDKDLEYFETLTTAESQLIAENHHDELFLIDE